jgi:hypothetical protein
MGSGGIAPLFLTSALGRGELSVSPPCRFTLGKIAPGTHWIGSWVGPTAVLDAVEKRRSCAAGNRTRAVQPVDPPLSRLHTLTCSAWILKLCGLSSRGRTSQAGNEHVAGILS